MKIEEHVKSAVAETAKALPERQEAEVSPARERIGALASKRAQAGEAWDRLRNHRAGFDPGPVLEAKISGLFPAARQFADRCKALDDSYASIVQVIDRELNREAAILEAIEARHAREREDLTATKNAIEAAEREEAERSIRLLAKYGGAKVAVKAGA